MCGTNEFSSYPLWRGSNHGESRSTLRWTADWDWDRSIQTHNAVGIFFGFATLALILDWDRSIQTHNAVGIFFDFATLTRILDWDRSIQTHNAVGIFFGFATLARILDWDRSIQTHNAVSIFFGIATLALNLFRLSLSPLFYTHVSPQAYAFLLLDDVRLPAIRDWPGGYGTQ